MARWPSQIDRFWSYVGRRGPDECWTWTGPKDSHGYGQLMWDGVLSLAHRVSMRIAGVELGTLCALHRCDNPPCVNPAHLFPGTRKDNAVDRDAKGRAASHVGVLNGRAKLTEDAVREILSSREMPTPLARRFGVSPSMIQKVKAGQYWAHVDSCPKGLEVCP